MNKYDWRDKRFCPYTWQKRTPPYQTYGVYDNKTGDRVVQDLDQYERACMIAEQMNKDYQNE